VTKFVEIVIRDNSKDVSDRKQKSTFTNTSVLSTIRDNYGNCAGKEPGERLDYIECYGCHVKGERDPGGGHEFVFKLPQFNSDSI
jgi:hypothetical protein